MNKCHSLVLYEPASGMVALEKKQNSYETPCFQPHHKHVAVVGPINDYLFEMYGLRTNVVKCIKQEQQKRMYVVEVLDKGSKVSQELEWVPLTNILSYLDINVEDIRRALRENHPCYGIGYKDWLYEWAATDDDQGDLQMQQIRSWETSSLYKLSGADEEYYIKAVPPVFQHEPSLSKYLNDEFPGYVPFISKQEGNRYKMKKVNGSLLGYSKQIDHWSEAMQRLGTIQLFSTTQFDRLQQIGCPLFPLSFIPNNVIQALSDLYAEKSLTKETYDYLLRTTEEVKGIVEDLRESNIPLSLEHGDFFGGNVMVEAGEPILYDWADSRLAHPFFSVVIFLEEVESIFSTDTAALLLEEYLSLWTKFLTMSDLKQEYSKVKQIAPVYGIVFYERKVAPMLKDHVNRKTIIETYIEKWIRNFYGDDAYTLGL